MRLGRIPPLTAFFAGCFLSFVFLKAFDSITVVTPPPPCKCPELETVLQREHEKLARKDRLISFLRQDLEERKAESQSLTRPREAPMTLQEQLEPTAVRETLAPTRVARQPPKILDPQCFPDNGRTFVLIVTCKDRMPGWVRSLKFRVKLIVYFRSKLKMGRMPSLRCGSEVEERLLLPNRGKEATTYLHYLATTPDEELGDLMAFVHCGGPGDWHAQVSDFFDRLNAAYLGMTADAGSDLAQFSSSMVDLNQCPCVGATDEQLRGGRKNLGEVRFDFWPWRNENNMACYAIFRSDHGCKACSSRYGIQDRVNDAECAQRPRFASPELPIDPESFQMWPWTRLHNVYRNVSVPMYDVPGDKLMEIAMKHGMHTHDQVAIWPSFHGCCAQFILQPWRVKLWPKELYKEWMDALLTHMEWDDHATSRLFEWSWRRIFHAANMTLNEARLYHRVGAMIHSSRARN